MVEGTELFEIMHTTRAMRRLKPDPVPDALIDRILEAGQCAPNGGNAQRWRFLVVKDPAIKQAREALIPLHRIADPREIANAIEFMISPLSGFVTGQDLCVDGGFTKTILSHIPGRPSSRARTMSDVVST